MSESNGPSEEDCAHDVLAAEEFGVPAPDPGLRHGPVMLPTDPTGIAEAHDVLAAEEFAIPDYRGAGAPGSERDRQSRLVRRVAVGALALAVLLRLGRKRHA